MELFKPPDLNALVLEGGNRVVTRCNLCEHFLFLHEHDDECCITCRRIALRRARTRVFVSAPCVCQRCKSDGMRW